MTKICLLEQAGKRSPDSVMPLTVERLRERGCSVEVWMPENAPASLLEMPLDADLYVWKSHDRLSDSLAAEIHARGLPIVNDYIGTLQVRGKIVTSMRLMRAGLPTPEAYYASSIEQLRSVVKRYPLVVKPNAGRRGQRITVVYSEEELAQLEDPGYDIFAQEYLRGSGLDLKAYAVGERVFGVARPFPVRTAEEKRGKAREVGAEVREVCLRCGELFGQELYGVDLIETPDGPFVIEINCFPGFKGVPEADRLLAEHLLKRARQTSALAAVRVVEEAAS